MMNRMNRQQKRVVTEIKNLDKQQKQNITL